MSPGAPALRVGGEGGTAALSSESLEVALGLSRLLRGAGLPVPLASVLDLAAAVTLLGLEHPAELYRAGFATLLTRPEQRPIYDRCFAALLSGDEALPLAPGEELRELHLALSEGEAPEATEGEHRSAASQFSAEEVLATRDFAELSEEERREAAKLLAEIRLNPARRRTRRLERASGVTRHPDLRDTVRQAVRRDGELRIERHLRARREARRIVLLLDVSGSMEAYSRELLRFAQLVVAARTRVEVFSLGTRLTRLTRELTGTDPERALRASVAAIPDLAGGTRLGENLARFNSLFGVRGLARGAVVVICSDGIDRGDPAELGSELARLGRVAHRIIWVNPLKASPGYAPLTRAMVAAMPHLDAFVEGHSVAALASLAQTIASALVEGPPGDLGPLARAPQAAAIPL
jgi:uncharacterized protein